MKLLIALLGFVTAIIIYAAGPTGHQSTGVTAAGVLRMTFAIIYSMSPKEADGATAPASQSGETEGIQEGQASFA
ncbi:hypothetical protein [Alterisphingorhabdus coralli]|uniref:DUF1328 domain-containing protein n=1 Tax=Alterisphingorhabdus coralli TaxID=3071408 RepID=A0AA97F7U3_9SPHN|nr:hypothetical protein [Parasphingorhabdus sp. SCSIO 66989]WOE74872.1 hypothetical protein RB602_13680 [Parasphingorhabdus sp. SCSIO 66989]